MILAQWIKNWPVMQETQETWFNPSAGRRKWQSIPIFLPEKSHRGTCWATVRGVPKGQTQLSDQALIT